MRFISFSVLLLFSFLPLSPAIAERALPAQGVMGCLEAAPEADLALEDVVSRALSLQLERRKAHLTSIRLPAASPSFRVAEGLRQAAAQNAQYLLLGQYATSPREFTLSVELYDTETGQKLRAGTASGRIGLSLDSVVTEALDQALAGIEFRQPAPQPLPAGDFVQAGTPGETSPAVGAARETTPAAGTAVVPETRPAGSGSQTAGARRLFALASGAAPFIPLGVAGAYADLGILATFSAVLRFPLGPGILGTGLLSGLCALKAAGAASSAQLLVVPVGVDLRYFMNEGGFPGIVVHVSAGPAFMNTSAAYAGSLTKVVPYVLAGLSLDLPFTPFLGLALEASWAAFLESMSLPIMAFAPEVSLYVRF